MEDAVEPAETFDASDFAPGYPEAAEGELTEPPPYHKGLDPKPFDPDVEGALLEALSMDLPVLMKQSSVIHALMQRWTEKVADLEADYMLLKAARKATLGEAVINAAKDLVSDGLKATKDLTERRARNSPLFLDANRAMIDAHRDWQRAAGVVSAIYTKRNIAEAMLYKLGNNDREANRTYTVDDDLI